MTTILGEEWRTVHDLDRAHLKALRPDAEVLTAARANIECIRKGEVRLRLVDAAGNPLRGYSVRLSQHRHAFVFGCSSGGTFAENSDPARRERNRLFVELFNGTHAKCYWDEKWHHPIETRQGLRDTAQFTAEIDWGVANGLVVRGHPLVWTVPKAIPQWMRRYSYEQQLGFLEHHVRSLIQAAAGRIKLWDLVNEMLWEPSLRNLASRDWPHLETTAEMLTYIEPAMRWARAEDPTARYVLNDYGLERTYTPLKNVTAPDQRQRYVELVTAMRERGVAPDAIGTQGHVGKWFPLDLAHQVFDDLARAGVPVQVSEFWASPNDHPQPEGKSPEEIAADMVRYVCDYYTVAFAHPAVDHLSYWGGKEFFDRDGWVPSALYRGLQRLIRQEWWTNVELISDADGFITTRAFYGDYYLHWHDAQNNPHVRTISVEVGRNHEGTLILA